MRGMVMLCAPTLFAVPTVAAQQAATEVSPQRATGADFFYASDSDGTEVVRTALNFDIRNAGENDNIGISVEQAWYRPATGRAQSRERGYLRAAGQNGKWQWRGRLGTDGHTVIGSAAVNDTRPFRKEFFVERDIVETRQGLARGLYTTFAGAAIDVPADDRNTVTALVGVQEFTGKNIRLHLRGSYIHVVEPEWGLSAQLRGRYFVSSEPREFDYYSPRWFAEVTPVMQLRRFIGGWELVGAGGLGVQRDSNSEWRKSRFVQGRFHSPTGSSRWAVNGAFTYTSTPAISRISSSSYSYAQFSLGVSRRF